MGEMPLVLFTVLSQMGVGAAVTLSVLDAFGSKVEQQAGSFVAQGIVIVTGLSMIVSLAHLGHPLEAYRALSHLSNSWLSREVALFSVFMALSVLYWRQWKSGAAREKTGLLTAATGLLAVFASGMVYMLPAQPAWNNAGPVIFFLLTVAVLGPLFVAALLHSKQYVLGKNAFSVVAGGLIGGAVCFWLYLSQLLGQGGAAAAAVSNLSGAALWLRLLIGWAAPVGILAYAAAKPEWNIRKQIVALFVLVLIGEMLGRGLFYGTSVVMTVVGM